MNSEPLNEQVAHIRDLRKSLETVLHELIADKKPQFRRFAHEQAWRFEQSTTRWQRCARQKSRFPVRLQKNHTLGATNSHAR